MQQRDYLLRQIELMSQAIVALIRRLLGMKDPEKEEQAIQATNELLKEYLDTSLEEIAKIPTEETIEFLTQNKKLHPSNIDLFAEMLVLNADAISNSDLRKSLLEKALLLLEWIDKTAGIYSMERNQKISALKQKIQKTG